jgi:hypothetical protein
MISTTSRITPTAIAISRIDIPASFEWVFGSD